MSTVIARKNQRLNKQEQRFADWCKERDLIAVFDENTRQNGEVGLGMEWIVGGEVWSHCYQVCLTDYPELWQHRAEMLKVLRDTGGGTR